MLSLESPTLGPIIKPKIKLNTIAESEKDGEPRNQDPEEVS